MKIKVKKLYPDAQLPTYATDGSAAFDFYAYAPNGFESLGGMEKTKWLVGTDTLETGISIEVPEGHVMLIYSRSGHGFNHNVRLANCVGVIDSDYRGAIKVKLTADGYSQLKVSHGDRIAQGIIMPYPKVEFEEVDELSETQRGTGGFGSTGK